MDEVDNDLQGIIENVRTQEEEFENREQARREEEARQEHIRRNTRPTGFSYQTITSTPLRTQAPYPTTSSNTNRHTSRGIFFDPKPTRHSYAQPGETNSNDDYDQISGDSMSQDMDMNDRISPTGDRDTNGKRRSNWQQSQATGYGTHATGGTGRTSFQNEHSHYPQRNTITCY